MIWGWEERQERYWEAVGDQAEANHKVGCCDPDACWYCEEEEEEEEDVDL